MYHDYTQEELRAYCRSCIESLEIWARRLVHEKMTETFGENYIDKVLENGQPLVKREIRDHVHMMMDKEPDRFRKAVDTLFIDQIIYFLCNQSWYSTLFKPALDYAYPQGCAEAREFLGRLVQIRNPLSHSNPVSIRKVEQAICYSHDFVDGLKQYYKDRGEDRVWNVPQILKVKDSMGNCFENIEEHNGLGAILTIPQELNCGDIYSVEIEVDSSFDQADYTIEWRFYQHNLDEFKNNTKCIVEIGIQDVGASNFIVCIVRQNKLWHKYSNHDSKVTLAVAVLPPIE